MTGQPWTDALTDTLRGLWHDGHSAAEIGRRMNRSKNSVVGHAHRSNLPARPSPIKGARKPGAPRPAYLPRLPPPSLATLLEAQAAPEPPQQATPPLRQSMGQKPLQGAAGLAVARARSVEALAPVEVSRAVPAPLVVPHVGNGGDGCQFIRDHKTGPGWKPIFCDAPTDGRTSYCPTHARVCFVSTSGYGQRLPSAPGGTETADVAEGIPG